MVVETNPDIERNRENERRLNRSKDERKEELLNELRNESFSVICLAYMYAKNFDAVGVDITEKIIDTDRQASVIEMVYQKAYEEGVLKGREVEGEAIRKKMEIEKNREYDDYDYFDDDARQDRISRAIRDQAHRNMVQPTNAQSHGKGKKKRHHR